MNDDTAPVENEDVQTVETPTTPAEAEPVVAPPAVKKPGGLSGKIILAAGAGSVLVALLSGLGTGWGLWEFQTGFKGLFIAAGLAAFALILGFVVGWLQRRRGVAGPKALRWLGMAFAAVLLFWLLSFVYTARTVPAIHDISTDLADPPHFTTLTVRADNLDQIPGKEDPTMQAMTPVQRWTRIHQDEYGDIRSVRINRPVAEVIEKAGRLAETRGWDIALIEPEQGRLEATETSRFFGFKDDVVIRVRPTEDATGSIVDMRSISRVGMSDLGVNAKRVRSFLADLSGTVSAAR
ncbi:MAG: DUF1499 domain-containing protein [Sphingomonadales bacterium]|jgi:uncharacterized protein (DUF1499 family)|nr:DUF1499 domain-containing protein [Sphingomonadales bacterium]MBK9431961.1 DUF1499 domain-containing protein [Sphingomonadales bacterium]MBL0022319.1 DUF1499 domain-containing protein [Sphingomonadales bacterium]